MEQCNVFVDVESLEEIEGLRKLLYGVGMLDMNDERARYFVVKDCIHHYWWYLDTIKGDLEEVPNNREIEMKILETP